MIINFSVQNFGSIKDKQTLSFEATKSTELEDYYIIHAGGLRLLKMALIYGANASGKTTMLKALDFLRDLVLKPAGKKTDELGHQPFLFDSETPNQNSILSIDFIKNDVRYNYEVVFNKKAIIEEELYYFKPNKAVVFKRITNIEKQLTEISFGSKIKKDKIGEKSLEANTLWNNTVLGGFQKTNIGLYELKEVTDWFRRLFPLVTPTLELNKVVASQIGDSMQYKKNIVNIIKKADFNISDVFVKEGDEDADTNRVIELVSKEWNVDAEQINQYREKLKITSVKLEFEHTVNGIKYILPIDIESDGTKKYYAFAGLLAVLFKLSGIVPIDELESSLHPDLFTHFILTFLVNAKSSQIIATTHNREILNNKDIFRNDAIWFTDKSEGSATKLYSLADFDSKVIRDTSSVYNAYKAGKLGGTPHLGDYYINTSDEEDAAN